MKIKISDLKQGPTRHYSLPQELVRRIKKFKQILTNVETASLEKTINDFKRDINPEKEIQIWEHIASIYQSYIFENAIIDLSTKKEVFSVILATSMGIEGFKNVKILNKDQIDNIIYRYQHLSLQ